MEVSRKWQFHFFLTIWQARGTTCLYHPHHIGRDRKRSMAKMRCGKYGLSVERKAYFVCLKSLPRQADKMGMMCLAYEEELR